MNGAPASSPGKPTSLRIDVEIRERIDAYRKRTRHSINAAVNILLDEALRAHEQDSE